MNESDAEPIPGGANKNLLYVQLHRNNGRDTSGATRFEICLTPQVPLFTRIMPIFLGVSESQLSPVRHQ